MRPLIMEAVKAQGHFEKSEESEHNEYGIHIQESLSLEVWLLIHPNHGASSQRKATTVVEEGLFHYAPVRYLYQKIFN